MGSTGAIFPFYVQFVKHGIHFIASRNQNAKAYCIVLKKSPKRIQVPVEGLIFAVPFQVKGHTPF